MKRIAILASGTGTNAERIVRYFQEKGTAEVAWIIASRASAGVIERAARLHVPCKVITPDGFASGEAFRFLKENEIDFIVLAGFLSRVPDEIVHAYPQKIVNIHPSLLPKFGGKGMYGMHVHEAVLAAGDNTSARNTMKEHSSSKPNVRYFPMILPIRLQPACMSWNIGIIRR